MLEWILNALSLLLIGLRFHPGANCCANLCTNCCSSSLPASLKITVSGLAGTCPDTGNCTDLDGDYVVTSAGALGQAVTCGVCSGTTNADCQWGLEPWADGTCMGEDELQLSYTECTTPSDECGLGVSFGYTVFSASTEASYYAQATEDHADICTLPITLSKESGCGDENCTWPATITVDNV